MKNIVFDGQMKKDAQKLFENISNENPGGVDIFMKKFQSGNDAAWHRFIKGAYNHPITWWIGLLQLQMQMGVWGPQRKMQSQIASNRLGQILNLIKDNGDGEILYKGVVYNLKYRKADVIGRFVGGVFTNYASTGGRLGGKHIQGGAKRIVSLNNFLLASYGASIKGVASGFFTAESVIQSILTGAPNGPSPYPQPKNYKLDKTEKDILIKTEGAVAQMTTLTNLSPRPVSIAEFCNKPENINIKGLCK